METQDIKDKWMADYMAALEAGMSEDAAACYAHEQSEEDND